MPIYKKYLYILSILTLTLTIYINDKWDISADTLVMEIFVLQLLLKQIV